MENGFQRVLLSRKPSLIFVFALAVTCPTSSSPTNGELLGCNTTEMLYDTVCRFSCKHGYRASGSTARRCTDNGTWSGTDLVCTGIRNGLVKLHLEGVMKTTDPFFEIWDKNIDFPVTAWQVTTCLVLVLHLTSLIMNGLMELMHISQKGVVFSRRSMIFLKTFLVSSSRRKK